MFEYLCSHNLTTVYYVLRRYCITLYYFFTKNTKNKKKHLDVQFRTVSRGSRVPQGPFSEDPEKVGEGRGRLRKVEEGGRRFEKVGEGLRKCEKVGQSGKVWEPAGKSAKKEEKVPMS